MLVLLCFYEVWVLRERWSATTGISSMNMCFILKNEFVLKDWLLMSLKLITMGSWKGSLNCNIIASRIEYFYSNVIDMTPLTKES